jgi:aminopeptidase N
MRLIAVVLSSVMLAGTSSLSADTYPRQLAVDAVHYRFAIALSESTAHIDGEASARFRIVAPVTAIELDLMNAMNVTNVTASGAPVAFTHRDNRLRLTVPADARPGSDVTFTISYGGTPANGLQVFTNIHGERVMFSEGWPNRARHWLPMIDHPYDKATGEMIITAPSKWQVVSNGVLVEEVDVDATRRRTHWRQSVPIASWLYAIGVARFDAHHAGRVGDVPLQTWAFPQDRTSARTLFEETTRRAMTFFIERVGPYPYEKLANVQASGFAGGMENATVIFYGEKGVASGRGPVVHEVAHQWFGNSVTERDWDDVWLSEGFATYFTHLYTEHVHGRDAFVRGLVRDIDVIARAQAAAPAQPIIHRNIEAADGVPGLLNRLVYQKGAWVLHMLRGLVGSDVFRSALREYYRRYRNANASTDDFRQVVEQASGRELGWFFDQWLRRPGVPAVSGSWRYVPDRKEIELELRQMHAGDPFRLPIEIGLTPSDGAPIRVERIELTEAAGRFTIPAGAEPASVVLDPNTWVLLAKKDLVRSAGL